MITYDEQRCDPTALLAVHVTFVVPGGNWYLEDISGGLIVICAGSTFDVGSFHTLLTSADDFPGSKS